MHQDELGDRVMGVVAGYLVWSSRIANQPQAVALVEHVCGHAMGEPGRELLSELEGMPAPRPGAVTDRIEIRDLRVTGVHGVLPEERERAQPFSLDIVAWLDMEAAQQSDDLADTVDYGALAQTAADVVGGPVVPAARGAGRAAGQRAADRGPPDRRGRGHGAQAAPAAGRSTWARPGCGCGAPADGTAGPPPGPAAATGPPWRPSSAWAPTWVTAGRYLRGAVEGLARRRRRRRRLAPLRDRAGGRAREQGPYLNVVVELATADSPRQLLERCRALEEAAGRVRTVRWGPRTLDADVLWWTAWQVDEPDLTVPHPRLWERRFVLQPLADLAPDLVTSAQLRALWWGRRPCG